MERLDDPSWGQYEAVAEYTSSMLYLKDQLQIPQPFTQNPVGSSSVLPSLTVPHQLSTSPALSSELSSVSNHSHQAPKPTLRQQQMPALPTAYGLHLPGPQLNSSSSLKHPPPLHSSSNLPCAYPKPKQCKQCLYDIDCKAICKYYLAHPDEKQEVIARRYSLEWNTISKILKHKQKWLNIKPSAYGTDLWIIDITEEWYTCLPNCSTKAPSNLESTDSYNAQLLHHGPLSDASLCDKAHTIARSHASSKDAHTPSPTHYHQLPTSFPNPKMDSQDEHPMGSAIEGRSDDEEEESDSEDGDGDDNPDMQSLVHQRLSALPHLHDSGFPHQIPSWSMASSLTHVSSEPHPSPHPSQSYQYDCSNQGPELPVLHPATEAIPPPPPISDTSMPTLTECEDFLTKICFFVDKGYGQGVLTPRRQEWLRKLKVAFFEAGSGIPITPDSDEER
ncbi:hypothetical protein GYMLUDRAFT_64166 [Collybiopsis luxurians FD-317 M1]|uniref:Uncharacterized protein n=1 Tax=Collybiopsis luxurians FD-317 M1 TaxID=944289 RepID=A0A0D0CCD6_9AGAR|nr:hypothetical protein GYMLUDRAFT_64166 [Collybiopsis luxurians FD-317 M1]